MRIRNFRLYRFRGFEDLQVTFPDEAKLIVFIGENGSGKSSLIDGIGMILRETFVKHHKFESIGWRNPLNVNNSFQEGSITIGLWGYKNTYNFNKSLFANRTRIVTEENLALSIKRDLTEEERMVHYKQQAQKAAEANLSDLALQEYHKLEDLQLKLLGVDSIELAETYNEIGYIYSLKQNFQEALTYFELAEKIYTKENVSKTGLWIPLYGKGIAYYSMDNNDLAIDSLLKSLTFVDATDISNQSSLVYIYEMIGQVYQDIDSIQDSIEYYLKAYEIRENDIDKDKSALRSLSKQLQKLYLKIGDAENANKFKIDTDSEEEKSFIPQYKLKKGKNDIQLLDEEIDIWTPLILHYSVRSGIIKGYSEAEPMAFRIPITTNFDLISDWFTEYENDENRKRLRINHNYRSDELETIREVITKGLSFINDEDQSIFSDLQSEIDTNVKDGKVSLWLSIKKNGINLNVKQLSDGEKRILVLLIDITRRLITAAKKNNVGQEKYLKGDGIVLIDEIEQHLHPKWQKTLLPTLNKLFPNLQFIVTTHSPLVVSNLFLDTENEDLSKVNEYAAVYRLTPEKAIQIQTTGRDVGNVLGEYFGVERRSYLYQKKINSLFEEFDKDEIDVDVLKHKYEELKKLLGETDPDVQSAETIMNGIIEE